MRWAASDVSPSSHLAFTFQTLAVSFLFCVVFWVWGVCCFVVFLFPVLQVFWNPEFSAQLDLDDRQGLIASSAMQQKKKNLLVWCSRLCRSWWMCCSRLHRPSLVCCCRLVLLSLLFLCLACCSGWCAGSAFGVFLLAAHMA